jgi:hypothetical protein
MTSGFCGGITGTVAALGLIILTSRVSACEYQNVEDPMGDEKIGFLAAEGGSPALAFKCWSKGQLLLMVNTRSPSNVTPTGNFPVRIKIDGNQEFTYSLKIDRSGAFALGVAQFDFRSNEERTVELLIAISGAKSKIGVAFGSLVANQGVNGSKNSVQRFLRQCGIALSSSPSVSNAPNGSVPNNESTDVMSIDISSMTIESFDKKFADGVQASMLAKLAQIATEGLLADSLRRCVLSMGKFRGDITVGYAVSTCRNRS